MEEETEVWREQRSDIDANCEWPCGGKRVYFFSCRQKNVTGDIKKWKMRKLHYHPETTCPFPAPPGKEN